MSCISRASAVTELPVPLAVCCHDAGGANLIAAWLAAAPARDCRVCAQGPARAVFAARLPQCELLELPATLERAACLLSGSGWASDLEHRSRSAARERGIPSLAVLDHWVNYRARFSRDGIEVLPDGFIVTDPAAAELAAQTFGADRPILMWDNRYLHDEAARVRELAPQAPCAPPRHLLVVLEPVRQDWDAHATSPAEFRALDYLMANLTALTPTPAELAIRLRPHPAESPDKYRAWAARQTHLALELSGASSLAADLAWADAVAGLNSYALVVARAARRRALSYLPPGAPPCVLHDPGIERLAQLTRERA
jgi:hypothetical protein